MYLVVIAWLYVVLMMSVAEATNTTGTILGALITFVLYGVGPVALVVYLMSAPARNSAIKKRNAVALPDESVRTPADVEREAAAGDIEKQQPPAGRNDI